MNGRLELHRRLPACLRSRLKPLRRRLSAAGPSLPCALLPHLCSPQGPHLPDPLLRPGPWRQPARLLQRRPQGRRRLLGRMDRVLGDPQVGQRAPAWSQGGGQACCARRLCGPRCGPFSAAPHGWAKAPTTDVAPPPRSGFGKHALPEQNGASPGSCAYGPEMSFVGVTFEQPGRLCGKWNYEPGRVEPPSLFAAQLRLRGGGGGEERQEERDDKKPARLPPPPPPPEEKPQDQLPPSPAPAPNELPPSPAPAPEEPAPSPALPPTAKDTDEPPPAPAAAPQGQAAEEAGKGEEDRQSAELAPHPVQPEDEEAGDAEAPAGADELAAPARKQGQAGAAAAADWKRDRAASNKEVAAAGIKALRAAAAGQQQQPAAEMQDLKQGSVKRSPARGGAPAPPPPLAPPGQRRSARPSASPSPAAAPAPRPAVSAAREPAK